MQLLRTSWLSFFSVLAFACDGNDMTDAGTDSGEPMTDSGMDAGGDAGPPPPCSGPPGLYQATFCDDDHLAVGVEPFHPQYELWSDDAHKDRYILLPDGETIDTTDPDNWIFPVGTTVWKTFSLDGVRLETRILRKVADGVGINDTDAWQVEAWAWNMAQTGVTEVSTLDAAFRENVLGTDHDIPSRDECVECHTNQNNTTDNEIFDTLNGFSAIQLNHDEGGVTLQQLLDDARLSTAMPAVVPPASWIAAARMPGTEVEAEALGYLHANCGHCHRERARAGGLALESWVDVGTTTVEAAPTWQAIGAVSFAAGGGDQSCEIHPLGASADQSVVMLRMMSRSRAETPTQMPPLATELVDMDGIATVRAWLETINEPTQPDGTTWPCLE